MFKSLKLIGIFTFCLGVFGCSADSDVPWVPIEPMPHATCEDGDICAYDSQDKFLGIVLYNHYTNKKKKHWKTEILLPEGYHLFINENGTENDTGHTSVAFLSQQWPFRVDDSEKSLFIRESSTVRIPNTTYNFVTIKGGGFETPKRICFGGFPELLKTEEQLKMVFAANMKSQTNPTVYQYTHISDVIDDADYRLKAKECPKGMLPDVLDLPITLKDSDGNVFTDELPKVTL